MLRKMRQSGLVWPTILAAAALAVLVGLGTWQVQRKQWKEALIAKIAARIAAPPTPMARIEEAARSGGDIEYTHVSVRGRFHHDKERYFYAPGPAGLAWHVYTPLEYAPSSFVWINRGVVPDDSKAPRTRPAGQITGEAEVTGLARAPARRTPFTPDNDVAHNLWYWPDLTALTASAFAAPLPRTAPLSIDADRQPEPPGGLPRGGVTRLDLPNRHLEYAVTWYGLALTLIGVYVAFAVDRLRKRKGGAP